MQQLFIHDLVSNYNPMVGIKIQQNSYAQSRCFAVNVQRVLVTIRTSQDPMVVDK